jgi:putative ABC transport system permease protein
MLFRKLLRTLWNYKAQFISMIIMITLGVGVFSGFNAEWYSIKKDTEYFFDLTNFADYRITCNVGFTNDDLNKVKVIAGVDDATLYLSMKTTVKDDTDIINLTANENMNVSGFTLIDGKEYDENNLNAIWISDQYANKNNVKIGDDITLTYSGYEITFKVLGLIKSGEYNVCVPDDTQLMPDYSSAGFAYTNPQTLKKVLNYEVYPQINIVSNLEKKDLKVSLENAIGKKILVVPKDDVSSYSSTISEINEGKTMGNVIPIIFLLIAVLTMMTTMHRLTANEKLQIGTLKALGFKDRRITFHYTSYALFIGIIGSALGIGLGYFLCWFIVNPTGAMGTYFDLPNWKIYFPWFIWIVIIGIVGLLTLIGYLSVKNILKGTAAETLKPYTPKKMKNLMIEKTKWFHKLGFSTRWNMRDIFRHKSRTLMSIFGVLGCALLLTATLGTKYSIENYVDTFYDKAMNYNYKLNLSENVSNEKALELSKTYNGDYSSLSPITIDDESYVIEVYAFEHDNVRLLDKKTKIMSVNSNGAYLCRRIADKYNLKKGDTFKVTLYGTDTEYELIVEDVIISLTEGIVVTTNYAEKIGLPYKINTIYTFEENAQTNEIITSIQSKDSIMESFDELMIIMNELIILLVLASIILGIVVLYNLGVMSYMERYRELATLKVLGFKDKKISKLLITQNMWITVFGLIIGMPLGVLVLKYLIEMLASTFELILTIDPRMFIYTIILVLLTSFMVSLMISRKNKYIDMVESLKAE